MTLLDSLAREHTYIAALTRTLLSLRHATANSSYSIVDIVTQQSQKTPNAAVFYYLDQVVTYAELEQGANRYAHWALSAGISRGEAVALLMENRPEYVMAWLGLLKIGAIAALINTHLRSTPLAHSIAIVRPSHIIVGSELSDSYSEARSQIDPKPMAWCTGTKLPGYEDLDGALVDAPSAPIDPSRRSGITLKDKAFYIYTSGTTGLPKASNFTHLRMLYLMHGVTGGVNAKAADRMYNVLPLYHTAGGVCALGTALLTGGSVIIKRKFSATEFWPDVHKYSATMFQYIGELCRYLLNAPASAHERDHALRVITGNGLRAEIWKSFQQRFAIPKIVEFYGATEGNVSMVNYDGTIGAVGRIPFYMRPIFTTRIVKFDIALEMPMRGADGFCIECADGETGETIGKITNQPGKTFDGYNKADDTQNKILHDVFRKGDHWFRTGDLMRREKNGYFYFVDRIGDTFRWKGENVATSEVSEALGMIPGIKEANVYGVAVAGMDGRAGMAALVTGRGFELSTLGASLATKLPSYARPIFLRLLPAIEVTGTFKQRKVDLVKEGFDPSVVSDRLYWFDPLASRYQPLTPKEYGAIVSGSVKL